MIAEFGLQIDKSEAVFQSAIRNPNSAIG